MTKNTKWRLNEESQVTSHRAEQLAGSEKNHKKKTKKYIKKKK